MCRFSPMIRQYFPMDEHIPPGIRFHPSDEELIEYYLYRKLKSLPLPPNVITDIELYSYNPWDLPSKALFGDDEWYFFTPRDRKYLNGERPNRTTSLGYWKATGTDKPIFSSYGSRLQIGVKKALVFYKGKPPSGRKMAWIMTEYRLPDASRPLRSRGSMRLDDWVICRIRQKGNMSKNGLLEYGLRCDDSPQFLTCHEQNGMMLVEHLLSAEHHVMPSLIVGNEKINGQGIVSSMLHAPNIVSSSVQELNKNNTCMSIQFNTDELGDKLAASQSKEKLVTFGTTTLDWQNMSEDYCNTVFIDMHARNSTCRVYQQPFHRTADASFVTQGWT